MLAVQTRFAKRLLSVVGRFALQVRHGYLLGSLGNVDLDGGALLRLLAGLRVGAYHVACGNGAAVYLGFGAYLEARLLECGACLRNGLVCYVGYGNFVARAIQGEHSAGDADDAQ